MADLPERIASQMASTVSPAPQTAPVPVITMRREELIAGNRSGESLRFLRMPEHQAAVRTAEAERIGKRRANAFRFRFATHDRHGAFGIGLDQVGVHRS